MNTKAVTWIIIILLILGALYAVSAYVTTDPEVAKNDDSAENNIPVTQTESVLGCYVATLGKDVYSLKISSQQAEKVSGTLVFKNFQKDSSQGTFSGTYKEGILLGDYSFNSEGMDSVSQTIFKRVGNDFVRGYGPLDSSGTRFSDLSKITYDPNQTFKASTTCATSL